MFFCCQSDDLFMSSDPSDRDDPGRQRDTERDAATADATTPNTSRTAGESNHQGGAGETVGRAFDSARDTLTQSGPKSQLTFTIGLFAVIGVGFGLTGIVILALVAGGGSGVGGGILAGIFLISLLVVLLLTGSIVGAFCGLRVAERLRGNARTTYLTSFVGTAVGYVVMVAIAVVLIGLTAGGGGGQTGGGGGFFNIVNLLVPLIVLAIPVGLTGVGSSFLVRRTTNQ
jgi:hypothetical protein